jgi:hypothetical protein
MIGFCRWQNWKVTVKDTVTSYPCMGYCNSQESRNYSWKSNNWHWQQGFLFWPVFYCYF